jgi:hypothetical protein
VAGHQQRAEQAGDEVRAGVLEVGVDEHQHVARGDEERAPQRLALARPRRQVRQHVGAGDHGCPRIGGARRGGVGGERVHHHQLVHQRCLVHQVGAQ